MGRRGPRPEPTALALAKGDPGRRAAKRAKREPSAPKVKSLPAPPGISEKGKEYWKYFMRLRAKMGAAGEQWITPLDVLALRETCESFADLDQVRGVKNSFEEKSPGSSLMYPVKDDKGNVKCLQQTPIAGILAETSKRAMKALAEFGMNPSARSRIVLMGEHAEEKDELEDLIDL